MGTLNLWTLERSDFTRSGIFGGLYKGEQTLPAFYTLEHAYPDIVDPGAWEPKVPTGTYTCVRGTHSLAHSGPFETFEITGVPGHQGILFHVGNTNDDSEGCVLLGTSRSTLTPMILESKKAFAAFMELMKGVDSFTLVVQ